MKRPIKKERRKRRILSGIIAVVLVAAMALGMFLNYGTNVQAAPITVVDPDTTNNWTQFTAPDGQPSTQNVGRIWTDKSVFNGDYAFQNSDSSGLQGQSISKGDNADFLVALSALSSTSNLKSTTVTTTPLDIVLVLDTSGSMDNDDGHDMGYSYTPTYSPSNNRTYYIQLDNGTWVIVRHNNNGWYYTTGNNNRHYVDYKRSADDQTEGRYEFNTRSNQQMSRMEALQNAANTFVDSVAALNDDISNTNQQHRISLVKFASDENNSVGNDFTRQGYNCSQVVSDLTSYTSNNASSLKNTINRLYGEGATRADYGLHQAQRVLNGDGSLTGARDNAQKIVIFFTDGEPTESSSWSNSVASSAVGYANSMKQGGALIYSIGVVQGADPSDDPTSSQTSNMNKFLQAVSSNYKNATYEYEGWGPFGSYQWSFGTRTPDANYYYAASDADELDQVFEDITSSITQNAGSGSPIVDNSTEGNTDPGNLVFTDQLGSYMQVTGTGAGDDTIQLAYGDQIYNSTSKSTSGNVDTYHFEGTVGGNAVYGEANLADLTVEVTHSTDLATGDIVKVTIPATLIPMRNYNVDTDNKTMNVSQAYPVRLFYGVSLKANAEKALSDTTSDEYKAIIESQATDGTIDFYSNNFVKNQADGETTAVFEPNASNKFYYFTQSADLYLDQAYTEPATLSNLNGANTLYYKDTYWQLTGEGTKAEEITDGYGTVTSGTAEWDAIDWGDRWSDQAQIPAGTQRTSRPGTLTAAKTDNVTKTAANVLNPSWSGDDEVTQALGNNGKLSYLKPGSLEIKKTVDWGNASDDTKTNHNSFSFDITATTPTGENGAAENLNGTYNYFVNGVQDLSGTVKFKDGEGTVTMNGGDTLVIEGLPAGASFTVTEQNANSNGFSTVDATSQAGVDNTDPKDGSITGTIVAGSQVSLTFTNTYHATDVNLNTNTTLKVQKTLEGRDWRDGDSFDFTIDGFYAPTSVSEAPGPTDTTITVDASNKDANYTASFGDITFSAPGEYRYTVQEVSDPAEPIAGIDYSDAIYRVTVMVGDNGTGALTIDSVKIERMYNDEGKLANTETEGEVVSGDTMAFTNTYKVDSATQGIQGKKSYDDTTGGNPFQPNKFTFKLEALGGFVTNGGSADKLTIDAANTPMPDGAQNNAVTTGNVGEDFTFPSITFDGNDVGNTYVYKVTEQQGNEHGMTYSKAEHTVMIQVEEVTDDDGTHIKATVLGDYADPSKLVFENEYKPTEAKLEGSNAIHGTKTLTGREMQDGETYYFQLTAVDDNAKSVLPNAQTVEVTKDNMKDGSAGFTFADMSFTKVGTYTFTVNEVADENGTETTNGSGMTYDTNIATVKVVVSDAKDGSLKAEVSYSNDKHGETTDQALFTNVYEASMNYGAQGKGGINVTKTMKDRPMTAGEFSFSIDGINAEGSVTADEANQKLVDGDKSFQNVAAGDGVTSSMAKLQNVSFNQNDAGKTFSYIVDETTESGAAQVSYDKSQYRVDIQVVDNGDGTMHTVTTVTQIKDADGNDANNVVIDKANSDADGYTAPTFGFINDYNPNSATVGEKASHQIQVKKTVTGADSATDYTFTLTATGDNIGNITGLDENNQLTVKTDGTIKAGESQTKTFGDLTFSEPGTYTFTVQENQPAEDAGWNFDTTARTVTVVVTDLNDNQEYDGNLYIASVTGSPVEITNSYKAEPVIVGGEDTNQQITVQKSVTGKNPDGAFKFKIEPVYDDTYTEDVWEQNVEPVDDDFDAQTTISGVTTEQPQTASFDGIKFKATGEYKFKITEVEASAGNTPAGWTYDTHESFATVKVTDNGEGQLMATVCYDNTKATTEADQSKDTAAAFTNKYEATPAVLEKDKESGLGVRKTVTGAPNDEDFTFSATFNAAASTEKAAESDSTAGEAKNVEGLTNGKLTAEISEDFNAGDTKAADFGTVKFKAAGIYVFDVTEDNTATPNSGWTYDDSTPQIIVKITDNGEGALEATVEGNDPEFTNSYAPNSVTLSGESGLKATKSVTGAPATEEFTFNLSITSDNAGNVKVGSGETATAFPENGITMSTQNLFDEDTQTGKEDDTETVNFGDLTFTAAGIYTFKVTETTTTEAAGWNYGSGSGAVITVTVTDDYDGQLKATTMVKQGEGESATEVDSNNPTITNSYAPGSVTVGEGEASGPIQVTKNISGAPAPSDFSFTLTFNGEAEDNTGSLENIKGLTNGSIITSVSQDKLADNSETASFGALTFTAEGDYYFTVTENEKAPNTGWTYDNTPKTVIVHVTDKDYDGQLDATVEGNNPTVTNSYDHGTLTLSGDSALKVQKTVTGAPTDVDFTFTATFDAEASEEAAGTDGTAGTLEGIQDADDNFVLNATVSDDFDEGADPKTASFGDITFTQPGTYVFDVVETNAPPADGSGWTYDGTTKTITVVVTDNGKGALEADVTYGNNVEGAADADKTETDAAAFTNSYSASSVTIGQGDVAGINVQKTLTGRNWQEGDTFTFTLAAETDGAPMPSGDGNSVTITKETDKSASFGSIEFTQEGTYEYKVTETAGDLGGITYDTHSVTVTVSVTDTDHDGKLEASISYDNKGGNTEADQKVEDAAAFTNTYAPGGEVPVDPDKETEGEITLTKVLEGKAWDGDEFTFEITAIEGTAADGTAINAEDMPMPDPATATVKAPDSEGGNSASIDFNTITFNAAGTYVYEVREAEGDNPNPGMSYSKNVATVTVTVRDNLQGGYSAVVNIKNGTFTNTYGTDLLYDDPDVDTDGLNVVKNLTGHDMAEGQFEFTLKAKDEASAQKADIEGGLSKTFTNGEASHNEEGVSTDTMYPLSGMTFTQEDSGNTYTYTITETQGNADGYDYDPTEYTVTIKVTDDGNGTLTATTTVTGGEGEQKYTYTNNGESDGPVVLTFDNTYNATGTLGGNGEGAVKLNATKELTNRDQVAGEFKFNVTNSREENGEPVVTGTNAADGTVTFDPIEYTTKGMLEDVANGIAVAGKTDEGNDTYTYQYTVAEDQSSFDDGVTAIESSFQITVTVTDNNDGTLSIAVTYPEGSNDNLTFRNAYGAGEDGTAVLNIKGAKDLDVESGNNAPDIAGKYTFELSGSEGAPMPDNTTAKNDAAGNVSFGDITYTMENVFGEAASDDSSVSEDQPAEPETPAADEAVDGNEGGSAEDTADVPADETDGTEAGAADETGSAEAEVDAQSADEAVQPEVEQQDAGEATGDNVQTTSVEPAMTGNDGISALSTVRQKTFTYTVTETGSVAGVTNDAEASKTFDVTVTDNGDGTLSVTTSEVPGGLFKFTNTYSVTPTDPTDPTNPDDSGEAAVTITKKLTGRDMTEGEFSFVLKNANGETVSEAKNAADGSVKFTGITFDTPGSYSYTISEVQGNAGGVTYDSTIYKATATVTDNSDGTLSAVWSVTDADGNAVDSIVFHNEYSYSGTTTVTLGATKALDGRVMEEGEFNFLLKDSDGETVAKAVNSKDGAVQFDELSFDKPGTYEYTISEEKGDDATITYDDTVYNVTVTVADSGEGYLTASVDFGGETPAFTNVYTAPEEPTEEPAKPADNSNKGETPKADKIQKEEPAKTTTVQTGDSSPIMMTVIVMAAALVAIIAAIVVMFRRRNGR